MSVTPASPARERTPAAVQRPNVVGVTTTRADGIPKVKGEFEYSSDMHVEGDAVGGNSAQPPSARGPLGDRHLARAGHARSPRRAHAQGRSRTQDLRDGDRHQPVLARQHVRYQGEPVAIVAADHPETARRGADAIVVE